MSVKATKEQRVKETEEEEISEDLDLKVKKYLRGGAANFDDLKDKKLKGQLSHREFLHGASAKAAAKYEKVCTSLFSLSISCCCCCCCISENDVCMYMIQWLMPSEGGYLEADGPVEKTWRIKQEDIRREVDISSSRNQHDVILPGLLLIF